MMILNNTNNKIMTVIKELPEKVHEKFLNFTSVKNFIAIDERRNQTKVGISIYHSRDTTKISRTIMVWILKL